MDYKTLPKSRRPVLVAGVRTPFQKMGTGFKDLLSYQLGAQNIRALLESTQLTSEDLDRVILSTTVHNVRTSNLAREVTLSAGLSPSVPAFMVSAGGASAGLAISGAISAVSCGQARVVIAGGTDSASDVPISFRKAMRLKLLKIRRMNSPVKFAKFLSSLRPQDFLPDIPDVTEFTTGVTMGSYTESLAQTLNISRDDQDRYALRSHQLALKAQRDGHLKREMASVTTEKGETFTRDNGIRPDASMATLRKLKPSFLKGGTLTPGNSSFPTDGSAMVMIASEEAAEELKLPILARIRGESFSAHDPREDLLLGPVFATHRIFQEHKISAKDLSLYEIHEPFAAQVLGILKLLDSNSFAKEKLNHSKAVGAPDMDLVNPRGGALSIGNPFAPNFARLLTTASHTLRDQQKELGLVATCAGGALGYGLLIEAKP